MKRKTNDYNSIECIWINYCTEQLTNKPLPDDINNVFFSLFFFCCNLGGFVTTFSKDFEFFHECARIIKLPNFFEEFLTVGFFATLSNLSQLLYIFSQWYKRCVQRTDTEAKKMVKKKMNSNQFTKRVYVYFIKLAVR